MRATKSGRNILRFSGFAMVLMFAVVLAISGISLTRVGGTYNVASAEHTSTPTTTFLDIGDDWTWNAPLETTSTNFASKTYSPSTYESFYLYLSGGYTGISGQTLNSTVAKHSPGAVGNVTLKMYAYYKLPSFLADIGATLDFSVDFDHCFSTKKMSNVKYSVSLCGGPDNDANAVASPAKVTAEQIYLKVYAEGNEDGTGEYMQFTDMHITMSVASATNIKSVITNPVMTAWDGTALSSTAPTLGTLGDLENLYLNDRYIVGGNAADGWYFDAAKGDANEHKNIYLTSLRTDGINKKSFSYTVYDYLAGLKTATLNGFDLLTRSEDNTPVTKDGYTFTRANTATLATGAIAFPEGLESVTVKPFGYKDEALATSTYRGLQVTVVYDGKDVSGNDMVYQKAYRTISTNLFDLPSNPLSVTMGGFDYTPPTLPTIKITSNYTVGTDKVTKWIDSATFSYRAELEKDAREDVEYRCWLVKVDKNGNVLETIVDGAKIDANENFLGNDLTFTNLANGHYLMYLSAIDELGRIYKSQGVLDENNAHLVKMTEEQGTRFSVDNTTSGYTNANWGVNATVGLDEYIGNWTNKDIVVHFNNLFNETKQLCEIKYFVRYDGQTAALSTDWTLVDEANIIDGYLISADPNEKYGFQRTYHFKVELESGKVFEYSKFVKYDNWEEYTPYTPTLDNYAAVGTPYADLLTLTAGIYFDTGTGKYIGINDGTINGGSVRTLFYTVGGGITKTANVINNEIALDLFDSQNITAAKSAIVKIWIEDEAGNSSAAYTKTVYLAPAKIFVKFSVNNNVYKYYSNTTETPLGLISYKLYRTANFNAVDLISSDELEASFVSAYADPNAGLKDVLASGIKLKKPAATSKYFELFDKYYVVAINAAGDIATAVQIVDDNTSIVAATHTIQKARLAVNQETGLTWTYNGATEFVIGKQMDKSSFRCIDTVAGEEWKNVVWTGTLSFNGVSNVFFDINTGKVVKKAAQIIKNTVVLSWATGGDAGANYQIANYLGSTTGQLSCYATLTPAYLTLTTHTDLNKIYDGKINVNITSNDYVLNGIATADIGQVYLDSAILNSATYGSANVGKNYNITVSTVLAGNRRNNYILVNNLVDAIPLTQAVFSNVSISPKLITVSFGSINKTFDNTAAISLSKGASAADNKYAFSGLVDANDDVTLKFTGAYPDFNAGVYKNNIALTIALEGTAAQNYTLGTVTSASLSGEIRKFNVKGAKLLGVYVVDGNNEYLYKDTAGNVYQKNTDGTYTKYNKAGDADIVTKEKMLASEGCAMWADTKFVKGGSVIVNDHRFDLGSEVHFAVVCYTDTAMTIPVSILNLDYLSAKNNPIIINESGFTFNSESGEYNVSIGNFDKSANFIFATNAIGNTTSIKLFITDFDDVKFDGKTYNGATDVTGVQGNTVVFDGIEKRLDIIYDATLSEDPVVYSVTYGEDADGNPIIPMRAGTYTATLKFERNHGVYIAYMTLIIVKKDVELVLISNADTSRAFGEVYAEEVEKLSAANETSLKAEEKLGGNGLVLNNILSGVSYQYSTTPTFKTLLSGAPYLTGSGDYYVRAIFNGNADFNGTVSDYRKITIGRVNFHAYDVKGAAGEVLDDITIDKIIDKSTSTAVRNCFVIVYEQEVPISDSLVGSASRFLTKVPSEIGSYRYTVVHKDRIDYNEFSNEGYGVVKQEYDTYLSMTTAGVYNGKMIIGPTSVDSMGTNGLTNGNGTLNGTSTTPILPAIRADLGELMFYAVDQSKTNWKANFNSGLYEQSEALGFYTISTLYQTSLKIRYADATEQNVTDYNTVQVTLKADVADGSKLFRFDINSDGTYAVNELAFTKNSDGTISFETDKLGWFAVANTYKPAVASDNALTIGLSVGGAAIAVLLVGIIFIVIRKKRIV